MPANQHLPKSQILPCPPEPGCKAHCRTKCTSSQSQGKGRLHRAVKVCWEEQKIIPSLKKTLLNAGCCGFVLKFVTWSLQKRTIWEPFNTEHGAQGTSFWSLPQVKFRLPRDVIILIVLLLPPHNIYKAPANDARLLPEPPALVIWNAKNGNGAWLRLLLCAWGNCCGRNT